RRVSVPGYPFARERYWAPRANPTALAASAAEPLQSPTNAEGELLPREFARPGSGEFPARWTGSEFFLADHVVNGWPTLPGVAYLEMACRAARWSGWTDCGLRFTRVAWIRALVVEAETDVLLRFEKDAAGARFVVFTAGESSVHAEG